MVKVFADGGYIYKGREIVCMAEDFSSDRVSNFLTAQGEDIVSKDEMIKNTMTYSILEAHNVSDNVKGLRLKFDALASHDITYVGIIQTARASALEQFPIPYVLTNCHNSLCAVGGTINEDDHIFGLSAAKKYGGIYVPAHQAVIHQYMREMMAKSGSMILGSDSHTRYGALGTLAIGEGGPELVKQILGKTYDIAYPKVVGIYLENKPKKGVGPQDVALSLIKEVFSKGIVKNKVLEFIGPGIFDLSVDFRSGIDVMTTETTCLSSIWMTDDKVKEYYEIHKRPDAYKKMEPKSIAYYDSIIKIDLSKIKPMIALPFHPSNVYSMEDLITNPYDVLSIAEKEANLQLEDSALKLNLVDKIVDGKIKVDQGIIAGCAGGSYENIVNAANIIKGSFVGDDYYNISVYPASQPIYMSLIKNGVIPTLMQAGANIKTAFCGPCFGASDVPGNKTLSIRHTTRNFPSREGSKPSDGQISSVALMDALSIAATSANKGYLTPATDIDFDDYIPNYEFDDAIYNNRVYFGFSKPNKNEDLRFGPNIKDWPKMKSLSENIMLKIDSVILDSVTTTDELIPSGETSSYRSNPLKLAEFTLSRKDPGYVDRAKASKNFDLELEAGYMNLREELKAIVDKVMDAKGINEDERADFLSKTNFGSCIFALKPGDGSAREQAASCQRVLGGLANISVEYATKRYRSNLINWGMLPFTLAKGEAVNFEVGDIILIEGIKEALISGESKFEALCIGKDKKEKVLLELNDLTKPEKEILLAGSLINSYQK
ncbi:putative enzyme [Acetoanaerobium sticklandii]|uniref:Putative enzyme n=1 Tax=Acetoanaerobium sticklandii (strain ATCC 12662 / DSM 519 / JCM 1433 / CCUG 9281 / NCIMB 10654 / HF) TaxID=499177 RepID=E3PUF6_ACESD|nr:hydratase [Acetoanaerobium sticklandii]CBH22394.1 putative enzyme [Acetoanaerobium sticklandii]